MLFFDLDDVLTLLLLVVIFFFCCGWCFLLCNNKYLCIYKSNVCIFFKNFVLVYICRIYVKLQKSHGFWFFILCQIARRGRSCRSSRTDVWYIRIKSVNEYNGSPIDRSQKGQDISCPLRWSDMPEISWMDMGRIWSQCTDLPVSVFCYGLQTIHRDNTALGKGHLEGRCIFEGPGVLLRSAQIGWIRFWIDRNRLLVYILF